MSSVFDAGDLQRLDRERTLTEQAPRQLPENDRSPIEEPIRDAPANMPEEVALIMQGLLMALKGRIS